MIEEFEHLFNVINHGQSHGSFGIIPVEANAEEFFALPVFSDIAVLEQGIGKMFYMFFTKALNTKIVN